MFFSRSVRKIVVVLLLYPGLSVLIGVTFCKSFATASVVPYPLLKPSEFWCNVFFGRKNFIQIKII